MSSPSRATTTPAEQRLRADIEEIEEALAWEQQTNTGIPAVSRAHEKLLAAELESKQRELARLTNG